MDSPLDEMIGKLEVPEFTQEKQNITGIPWPRGMAEQCSRLREKGEHCLSAASLRAAEVGEPRKAPEGPRHGQYGFVYFCRKKSESAAGTRPGITKKQLNTILDGFPTSLSLTPFSHTSQARTIPYEIDLGRGVCYLFTQPPLLPQSQKKRSRL